MLDDRTSSGRNRFKRAGLLLFLGVAVLLLVLGRRGFPELSDPYSMVSSRGGTVGSGGPGDETRIRLRRAGPAGKLTPEQLVAAKVQQFANIRRDYVRAVAARKGVKVPGEVEAFFDALESGVWNDIDARWKAMADRSGQYQGSTHAPELNDFWPAVLDAYGAAEQAHLWPAQQLLDYGNAVLDSLRPGMVYLGGTDEGRWIPELLNETSGKEPHIIVTQNALADDRYRQYVSDLDGDRFSALTAEDSQRIFAEYTADAGRRFQHDRDFPDEPRQVRPGENISMMEDGRISVSGQVAVMAINERMVQTMMERNPDLSFAIQESSPLRNTYGDAVPLGPLMELRAQDTPFTQERATQSLDYWRDAAQRLLADDTAAASEPVLRSNSHNVVSAANLLAAHNFNAEAEQAYRLSMQLWPGNPEPLGGLADILVANGRRDEAWQMIQDFERDHPGRRIGSEQDRLLWSVQGPPNDGRP